GSFCKLCVGIYIASIGLAVAATFSLLRFFAKPEKTPVDPVAHTEPAGIPMGSPRAGLLSSGAEPQRSGSPMLRGAPPRGLGLAALLPALVYIAWLPDYRPYLTQCGTVALKAEPHNALVTIQTAHPVQKVTLFEDPLCPSCKAFHQRLVADDVFDKL